MLKPLYVIYEQESYGTTHTLISLCVWTIMHFDCAFGIYTDNILGWRVFEHFSSIAQFVREIMKLLKYLLCV